MEYKPRGSEGVPFISSGFIQMMGKNFSQKCMLLVSESCANQNSLEHSLTIFYPSPGRLWGHGAEEYHFAL